MRSKTSMCLFSRQVGCDLLLVRKSYPTLALLIQINFGTGTRGSWSRLLLRKNASTETPCGVDYCLVCYTPWNSHTPRTITPCQHNDICSLCHLRLRHLRNDKQCPICKTTHEQLVVDFDSEKSFADYPIWGNELGGNCIYHASVGMFFPKEYYETTVLPLFGYHCGEDSCDFDPVNKNQSTNNKSTNPCYGNCKII